MDVAHALVDCADIDTLIGCTEIAIEEVNAARRHADTHELADALHILDACKCRLIREAAKGDETAAQYVAINGWA